MKWTGELTSRTLCSALGTDRSGVVASASGYTLVVLSTPAGVQVIVLAAREPWLGTPRAEADEKARKAMRAWKCIV